MQHVLSNMVRERKIRIQVKYHGHGHFRMKREVTAMNREEGMILSFRPKP